MACEDPAGGLATLSPDAENGAEKNAAVKFSPLPNNSPINRERSHELWAIVRKDVFSGKYALADKVRNANIHR